MDSQGLQILRSVKVELERQLSEAEALLARCAPADQEYSELKTAIEDINIKIQDVSMDISKLEAAAQWQLSSNIFQTFNILGFTAS